MWDKESEEAKRSPVIVHVTGFKKFHGVAENPTETIVSNLKDYMKRRGVPKGPILGSCSILDTTGQEALVKRINLTLAMKSI